MSRSKACDYAVMLALRRFGATLIGFLFVRNVSTPRTRVPYDQPTVYPFLRSTFFKIVSSFLTFLALSFAFGGIGQRRAFSGRFEFRSFWGSPGRGSRWIRGCGVSLGYGSKLVATRLGSSKSGEPARKRFQNR